MQLMDHARNTLRGKTLTCMQPTTDIPPPSISAHERLWACEQKYLILQHLDTPPPSTYRLTRDELRVELYRICTMW